MTAAPLELKNGDRVAFVGGTFIEREAEHSLIETYVTLANPDKDIKFRNLGWAADTVKVNPAVTSRFMKVIDFFSKRSGKRTQTSLF